MHELAENGLVESQLLPQAGDRLGISALAHHLLHHVARRDAQEQKDDDEYSKQRWNREEQSPRDESEHDLLADRHIGPALAVEDSGYFEAVNPRLNGVHVLVKEEIDHRRIGKLDGIGLGVEDVARVLLLF